jgi:hypothetical protein
VALYVKDADDQHHGHSQFPSGFQYSTFPPIGAQLPYAAAARATGEPEAPQPELRTERASRNLLRFMAPA